MSVFSDYMFLNKRTTNMANKCVATNHGYMYTLFILLVYCTNDVSV